MKKYLFAALMTTFSLLSNGQQLPAPQTTGGMPLMEAISKRHSSRDMSPNGTITPQQLSNLLWAAWGISHDGKRTVATAINKQELSIYVVTPEGASLYDAASNSLTTVATGDLRSLTAMQDFAAQCPLNIVLVTDPTLQKDEGMQGYAAGAASQNIYLYCASQGIKTVVRASFKREELHKALNLPENKKILFIQTVGI
ncbi:MAG: nitroreductase family protein [Muribaculaceae bacterium]